MSLVFYMLGPIPAALAVLFALSFFGGAGILAGLSRYLVAIGVLIAGVALLAVMTPVDIVGAKTSTFWPQPMFVAALVGGNYESGSWQDLYGMLLGFGVILAVASALVTVLVRAFIRARR